MCRLQWREVDFKARKVVVRLGKGGQDPAGVTVEHAHPSLVGAAVARGGCWRSAVARGLIGRLRNLCLEAGVDFKGVHGLRHYTGTRLYRVTRDLNEVAHTLGHVSIETTRVYAKYDQAVEKDAVRDW